jgi:hypothetical protein
MTGARRAVAGLLATVLLGSGCVVWATVPLVHKGWAAFALFVAIAGVAAGALRLALGAGAGMLPASGPGAGSALLRLVAAGALIAAAGLVLPYVARGER